MLDQYRVELIASERQGVNSIPFEDAFVHELLELLVQDRRDEVDAAVQARVDSICAS